LETGLKWEDPPARPTLSGHEAQVWRAFLVPGKGDVERSWEHLSPEERDRAERFRFQRDRDRFILARSTLRAILGRYLDMAPAEVRFSYARHGKPMLAEGYGTRLRFNLAHSRDLALYALTHDREVGIDVEYMREDLSEKIADHYFSPMEAARINAMDRVRGKETFFRTWTCKEAYVKARGEGLLMDFNSFSISMNPGAAPVLAEVDGRPADHLRWSFLEIPPAPGYAAAMATDGPVEPVFWQWKPWSRAGTQ
jgi:4'-phosphopantetheinyl transferase